MAQVNTREPEDDFPLIGFYGAMAGRLVTMNPSDGPGALPPARLLETVTRTLRHEVGDLLQTIYSTVAILQERVPADARLERRFLSDLRARAETCKDELDAVHDLILPITLKQGSIDLAEITNGLVATFAARYKSVELRAEASESLPVDADGQRLMQVGRLLLAGACQSARKLVVIGVRRSQSGDAAEWSFSDDGHGASTEQLQWLTRPFATTQQALFGLGLALAKRVAELHGGRVAVENRPDEGFRLTMVLPIHVRETRG
jgi:signal transduction histidine kinase